MGWNYSYIPKLQCCTIEVWEWMSNFILHYNGCDYLFMLGFKLIHVSKRGSRYCRCLYLCVLGSPNLDHRCKITWLRSLLFWWRLTLNFKVKLNLKSQKFSHLEFVQKINHHQLKVKTTKFGQMMQNTSVKIPINLRVDWHWPLRSNLT